MRKRNVELRKRVKKLGKTWRKMTRLQKRQEVVHLVGGYSVPQMGIAREAGITRQRVHQVLNSDYAGN